MKPTPNPRNVLLRRAFRFLLSAALFGFFVPELFSAPPRRTLELRPGDHISIIGNTLAERMQHFGWLETLLQSRFPRHHLVIRNLGYSGDELTMRLRSAGFGSPDEHLTFHKTDVVFAFFGFNESFAGEEGLPKFRKDLEEFITHTLSQKYNGKTPPRLVLFSPIAQEDLGDPNLPDPRINNRRIALYTRAMEEVAGRFEGVVFVDLYEPSLRIYAESEEPCTINGIHLNEHGNKLIAYAIERALFADPPPKRDPKEIERLRQAVLDKNFYWFNRYRTVDGYNVYGGRSHLKYVDGISNRVVMQREMEVLDVMTANRDKRIWAIAQGGDLEVDDSNTPPFIPVKTNKPGKGPGGTHIFLDPEEAISRMKVAEGMAVNLFASEKEYPYLANPVQMAFDTKGRMFVAVMPSYPHWRPKDEMNDKVLIFEDRDRDGRAEHMKVFADRLHVPTGLEFWGGGLFVGQMPDLMFLKDTDGDDVADVRIRVLHGIDSADTHHALNSFVVGPGGALYFQEGTFHHTQVETLYGVVRCANAGVFRYEPRTHRFEVYVSYPFANPHGHVFERWGQDFVTDGTGNVNYYAAAFSGRIDFPEKHSRMRPFFKQRTRPCPGTEILSSRHFPEELQGNYLVANVIGFQGILQYRLEEEGSGFRGIEIEPILQSSDPNFRPVDMEVGPDGALYFLDWHNPLIGHMQHHIRDPSRDTTHGRIYRVYCPGRPFLDPPRIAGAPIPALLDLLKEPEDRVRYRARIELSARPTSKVIEEVRKWVKRLDLADPDYEHHLLEALWVHQQHNVVNKELLKRVLASPNFRARAAAVRVLCYQRHGIPEALDLLKKFAADPHPRVRLEAVRAASFFEEPDAVEVALITAEHPSDYYIEYTRNETLRQLEKFWRRALERGEKIRFSTEAGARFFVKRVKTEDLFKLEPDRWIRREILLRDGILVEKRREALNALAKELGRSPAEPLLDEIERLDRGEEERGETVVYDLARLLTMLESAQLRPLMDRFRKLALEGRLPVTRQVGFVALVAAEGTTKNAWNLAKGSAQALYDLASALPLFTDPELAAELYPRIESLLDGLPGAPPSKTAKPGVLGRFVRIELPGRRRTLTLAEVEVYSGGRNIAPQGKASQKNTSHGGVASRAIDGNTSGRYRDGGQTHTQENTSNPWWELDLGGTYPIDRVVVYNRTEGTLGKRLDGFTLKILSGDRREVFVREKIPAPEVSVSIEVGGGSPEALVRRAAMLALTYVRGQETHTFRRLARLAREGIERETAFRALARIPQAYWPEEEIAPLTDSILDFVRGIPPRERTAPAVIEAMQLADLLAAKLPEAKASKVRAELGELGVRVIRLGTVPHQMLFDKDYFVVEAGKPVELIFENNDIMPHNFVVTRPGALEEIGLLSESTATAPDAIERGYVPESKKILIKSRLLDPRESERLSFTAPEKPGVYPYVCTYPGHWRRMFGAMYAVADLDAYLRDPEAYLEKNPLPILDPMLKVRRPRTEWKLDDLLPSLAELDHGRSFANGKRMFQVANCTACHRLDGMGAEFGPDLKTLDPKRTPEEILRDILEPSWRINEKYYAYTVVTATGRVVNGLIVEETKDTLKIVENPLASTKPLEIPLAEVVRREKSETSIMPKGLLDRLTREEILDLLAFIVARGNPEHTAFRLECGLETGN